jgi:hypothetical protein
LERLVQRRISAPPLQPVSSGDLLRAGCLGVILGLVVAAGALVFAILWTGYVGPLSPAKTDAAAADITITVQETYLQQMAGQSLPKLPSGVATDVQLDLQPNNRLLFKSRLTSTLLGQNLGGDVSGTVILEAKDGQLVISFRDLNLLGFTLPAVGQTLVNEFAARLSQVINDQVRAGLGQNAYIMSLTTDDRQMVIRARWE